MKILAIDTSAKVASVCIAEDASVVYECSLNAGLTHSERIMPMVEQALVFSCISLEDIDLLACAVGPGSFTGIRIGVAAIKALSHALGKPCAAVNTLDALALNAHIHDGIIVPIMDARCNQVYTAIFDKDYCRIIQPDALHIDELCNKLEEFEGPIYLVGDGVAPYGASVSQRLGCKVVCVNENIAMHRASSVALAALHMAEQGLLTDYKSMNPVYLRKPQAEREYEKRSTS